MKRYSKITPEGTRDFLFEESEQKIRVENAITSVFEAHAYKKVITPTIEFFDVFDSYNTGILPEDMYKLSDSRGRLTVLRPDNTAPIARMVATRLGKNDFPVRLYYNQNVFVRNKSLSGRMNEISQCGIELIGEGGSESDMEVLALAAETMHACSPEAFRIELGHAGFFNAVLDRMQLDVHTREDICRLIESKNYAALGDLLDRLPDSSEKELLQKLPRLFGGREVFATARSLYRGTAALACLDALERLYDELLQKGLQDVVSIDLGLVNRSNYYTGVIFRGYAVGTGHTVLSGGRYDNLLGTFGCDAPAIGFGVDVTAMCTALCEKINIDRPVRIALTKGRLEKSSVSLFKTMGLDTGELENKGRRLILPVDRYEAVLAKAPDVITYVEHGVCDIGIVGKDTIAEHASAFFEVLDLGIGKCRFALACPKGTDFFSGYKRKVIASKYPKVASTYFESVGMDVDIIKIEGSVELAPLLGLADGIVDIVETGSTLKENGLEIVREIMPISARVIVNMASMKLRKAEIEEFLQDLACASQVTE